MVLGKLPVPGPPTNLDYSSDKCLLCLQKVPEGIVWTFFSQLSFLSSFSLSLGNGPI